ncbi:type VI secretion system amidase effector protein Tae4 [Cellvibrio sp. KY-GH-1]|uniref:type VI secretion system amidase effector protein Tae4 n=1 Tax=Cellvibrio sp. KY-GH-1 TaxID=2303332 RepID=UPI001CD990F6|nr:type VI secretion system amidase effector protein Tae4 [Cellvibrio sp. KY-GH-1]
MSTPRPKFLTMWRNFKSVYADGKVTSVGNKIGGKVKQNIDLGVQDPRLGFTNECALRMSYSLNYSGISIPRGSWNTVSGGDNKWYIFRVRDIVSFLNNSFGKPDKTIETPKPKDFSALKGILVFNVNWSDATGHATLWDGSTCSDHCYFPEAKEASIWILK